jgi:hypothetical protein
MAKLTLLAFPQRWDGNGTLELRVLALPRTNPLAPLDGASATFAATDLTLEARIVPKLGSLPKPAEALPGMPLELPARPLRQPLFELLRDRFEIGMPPAAPPGPPNVRIKKLLTPTYRNAAGISRSPSPFAVSDRSYRCALEEGPPPGPPRPEPVRTLSWGQILNYVLRQPRLAEETGLLFASSMTLTGGELADGGWLYIGLQPGSTFADLPDPGVVASYAARIPELGVASRPVFAAVLFPVTDIPAGGYDSVFAEAMHYDDGFAKVVHAAQPVSSAVIDTGPGTLPPVRDLGLRLGWDDEQIIVWMNRQLGIDPFTGAPSPLEARMSVFGYRVDVRETGDPDTEWTTLNEVKGPVQLSPELDLGVFQGELGIEAVPVNLQGRDDGDYWLPPYFAAWAGGSLVLSDPEAYRLTGQDAIADAEPFQPVGADVPLRYGHEYEFRVRLMDLSSGGPRPSGDPPINSAPAPTTRIRFRRYLPPKAVTVIGGGVAPDGRNATYQVARPRLSYPAAIFTNYGGARAGLYADRDAQLAELAGNPAAQLREVGIPDPDVQYIEVAVEVRSLAGDPAARDGFLPLYKARREFDANPEVPPDLNFDLLDVHHVAERPAPALGERLWLPTAREVRIQLTALCREDPHLDYFGTEAARRGAIALPIVLRPSAEREDDLIAPAPDGHPFQGIFLQPESPASSTLVERLAKQLALDSGGLTLVGKPGRRVVFACSGKLRHSIAPDGASVTFASNADLAGRWIMVVRVRINRDWTWLGASAPAFQLERDGHGVVAVMHLPNVTNSRAYDSADRTGTDLVFFDAIDPHPPAGAVPPEFPQELRERYVLRARYRAPVPAGQDTWAWDIRLPVAARPTQTPKLVSAGLAFSPYEASPDYSSTGVRKRRLFLELEAPPLDPGDRYYARVLAHGPDPMLLEFGGERISEPPEPELPIDPEPIRSIVPSQAQDDSGLAAMQPLERAEGEGLQFLLPLPPGMDASAPELFGFFTYELRVGHNADRWSTAQARFGPPLRVTGIQHPAPPLICQAGRTPKGITVAAPYATPLHEGRNLRPKPPKTDIWVLLYAQIRQIDGASWRNVLLARSRAQYPPPPDEQFDLQHAVDLLELGVAEFQQYEIGALLRSLGLPPDSRLTVVAVEMLPEWMRREDDPPRSDPLGRFLGEVRILRVSPLTPVQDICATHLDQ